MNDTIYRQDAIEAFDCTNELIVSGEANALNVANYINKVVGKIKDLPSAQPTLYGYRIEHLAYIARVMEKEGVTAEYAVRTFDDVGRMVKMILEEANEVVYENMYSRFIRFEPYEGEEE